MKHFVKKPLFYFLVLLVLSPLLLKLETEVMLSFDFSIVPFGIIFLCLFALSVFVSIKTPLNSFKKLAFAYLSIIPICLALAEFVCSFMLRDDAIVRPDSVLGFSLRSNAKSHITFMVDSEIVSDVTYHTDFFGLRVTTPNNTDSLECISFYGGSFTYGAGLEDEQTLPSQIAKLLPQYKVSNFGIGAAGAHTMLARIESERDSAVLKTCKSIMSFYIAIPHHIYRVFGVFGGPKYILDSHHKPLYQGVFTPQEIDILTKKTTGSVSFSFKERLQNQLAKSKVYKLLTLKEGHVAQHILARNIFYKNGYLSNPDYLKLNTTNDLELYFAILKQARELLAKRYNSDLVVVLWDYDMHAEFFDKYDDALKEFLSRENFDFMVLSEIIPDYAEDLSRVKAGDFENFKYRISRWDTHPNALANKLLARYIADFIKNKMTKEAHQ
ncbi:MAG: hypothetical protein PUJ79_00570 [Helicobacter sp.]|nr:hypothetical protein [Helicobacter sp.]MDY5740705.1 hypothetical protein [Helicobacter sp.]